MINIDSQFFFVCTFFSAVVFVFTRNNFAHLFIYILIAEAKMAVNTAFEPDNMDETPSSAAHTPKNASNNAVNGRTATATESTSFNLNLDTYFSDEKIRIPDRVS